MPMFTMTHKTWDLRLVFLLLCGAGVIVPLCDAACDVNDVQRCLPGVFGTNDINAFHCSQSGRTCIDNLRRRCVGSATYVVISKIADLAAYSCSSQGRSDLEAYTQCLTNSAGSTRLNTFTAGAQTCASSLQRNLGNSLDSICRASRAFESCIVSAFNALCQDPAARRFFGKFADIVEVGGCFHQYKGAASIPYITKLSMAIWAGIITVFFV